MSEPHSDALVVFGATGDLAYKEIFPALHAMARRGHLNIPVIGVAKNNWTVEQLRARARERIIAHGGLDPEAFDRLAARLRYVAGDYRDAATFTALRHTLGPVERPLFYLAIPPSLFGTVVCGLARSGCAAHARVIVEKPFGRNLASAKRLNTTIHESFPEPAVYRIDHLRDSREILQQHSSDDERHFRGARRVRLPLDERFDVLVANEPAIELAEHRFNEDAEAYRQPRYARAHSLLEVGKRVVGTRFSGGELQTSAHVNHGSLMAIGRSISLAIRKASRTN